ncbi:MAG: ABC transporter ATP-binding protein [Bacteroidales bacterium]
MVQIKIQGLECGYADGFHLGPVDMEIRKGSFTGIIGPNGSGKSTLFKCLTGDLKLQEGTIELLNKELSLYTLKERARKISIVTQFCELAPITVEEYVLMGRMPYRKMFQFYNSVRDQEVADFYIRLTGIEHLRHKQITELSGGEQQMASIALALTQEPEILLLDEATSHLDITHQIRILNLLQKLNEETGLTIVMIIHDLNMASEYCSDLFMMRKGGLYTSGIPQEVLTYENIEQVYKTVVLTDSNPLSGKPVIYPVSGKRLDEHKLKNEHKHNIVAGETRGDS